MSDDVLSIAPTGRRAPRVTMTAAACAAYRTPGDPPCRPGRVPLWPGGPALPAWVELEAGLYRAPEPATAAQVRYLRALGITDRPASKEQASLWIEQAREWKARVP